MDGVVEKRWRRKGEAISGFYSTIIIHCLQDGDKYHGIVCDLLTASFSFVASIAR